MRFFWKKNYKLAIIVKIRLSMIFKDGNLLNRSIFREIKKQQLLFSLPEIFPFFYLTFQCEYPTSWHIINSHTCNKIIYKICDPGVV